LGRRASQFGACHRRGTGDPTRASERSSFLKKSSKKLLLVWNFGVFGVFANETLCGLFARRRSAQK
jgi:hypothetical protein